MQKLVIIAAFSALALAGCNDSKGTAPASQTSPVTSPPTARSATAGTEARRAEFLNRIRAADPQHQTIHRAILNERNELGVILQRDVDLKDIPKLMQSLLTQMAKEFPREDLTIIAYTPTEPPRKIGTAHLNAATRDMTYTPVR